ncbi:MAG: YigZ family protein [Bacteroidaceae bacterium]|nr:YigZ family protein [Bacteroidaceae bacterium]
MSDTYKTIKGNVEGTYSEKRSKFLAFAYHVTSIEEVKTYIAQIQKKYYDARHVCYAYMLGPTRENFRANDNGEPSGTAGKPILGQINSYELTDILIVIVRYFGGIKLGTSGLIVAYRQAAIEALENAEIIEKTVDEDIDIEYDFEAMNKVMKIIKDLQPQIINQNYDNLCTMTLRIRKSLMPQMKEKLLKIEGLQITTND